MYPIDIVQPMKDELTKVGYAELLSSQDVHDMLAEKTNVFVVINSVCGCSAGAARPAAIHAIQTLEKQDIACSSKFYTTFAGYDIDALNTLRENLKPYPPSSPAMALFKEGQLVHFLERHHIEGSSADEIATNILDAFSKYC